MNKMKKSQVEAGWKTRILRNEISCPTLSAYTHIHFFFFFVSYKILPHVFAKLIIRSQLTTFKINHQRRNYLKFDHKTCLQYPILSLPSDFSLLHIFSPPKLGIWYPYLLHALLFVMIKRDRNSIMQVQGMYSKC